MLRIWRTIDLIIFLRQVIQGHNGLCRVCCGKHLPSFCFPLSNQKEDDVISVRDFRTVRIDFWKPARILLSLVWIWLRVRFDIWVYELNQPLLVYLLWLSCSSTAHGYAWILWCTSLFCSLFPQQVISIL